MIYQKNSVLLIAITIVAIMWGCAPKPTEVVEEQAEPFNSTVMFEDNVPPLVRTAALSATREWEGVIVEGLPDMVQSEFTNIVSKVGDIGEIDDVLVLSTWLSAQPGQETVGRSFVYGRPTRNGGLPYFAEIQLFNNLPSDKVRVTALHELGHAS